MRVYDLAKELGKDTSKEILDILEKHNINLKSSSNITDEQASIVKKEVGAGRGTSPARAEAPGGDDTEAPKKKIAAVFRPQNAQMKPQGQGTSRPAQKPAQNMGQRDDMQKKTEQTSESTVIDHNTATREERPQGSYQGNREDRPQGQGGYQGNRPQGQGGYQGNRPQGQGGYQGNRPQGQGGYQGNREGRPQGQGGYQGNREGRPQGQGGYQGNRPQGQGGYQGNRE